MPITSRVSFSEAPAPGERDHLVRSGGLTIGRIYRRDSILGETQWTWVINGVTAPPHGVMNFAGMAPQFNVAEAELRDNWRKWLVWARLQEVVEAPAARNPPQESIASSSQCHAGSDRGMRKIKVDVTRRAFCTRHWRSRNGQGHPAQTNDCTIVRGATFRPGIV